MTDILDRLKTAERATAERFPGAVAVISRQTVLDAIDEIERLRNAEAKDSNEGTTMHVLMFDQRFAGAVKSGQKTTTIRPKRKRPIRPGDELSLRSWSGKPYRSKQVELRRVRCKRVTQILIEDYPYRVAVNGEDLDGWEREALAKGDGFAGKAEMRDYFTGVYGLPFEGEMIEWED